MMRILTALILPLALCLNMFAQEEAPQAPAAGGRGGGGAALAAPNPQPYERIITKDAKSKKSLFVVHQLAEGFFNEIRRAELTAGLRGKSETAKTHVGVGDGGSQAPNRVAAWELHNTRVYLRDINFSGTAKAGPPIAEAVKYSNNATIIMSFN